MNMFQDITSNLARVREAYPSTRLIAVTKTQSVEIIRAALHAGQRLFGENRVQEALSKFSELRHEFTDIELHLIGPLQSNKAQDAVALFDTIQTVDRENLVEALAKAIHKTGRTPKFYVEINIGYETQKSGIAPEKLPHFLAFCHSRGLIISGLMCIPPQDIDPMPYFRAMKDLQTQHSLPHLSMGMSNDFEKAILCGSTEVRLGTALFGQRSAY